MLSFIVMSSLPLAVNTRPVLPVCGFGDVFTEVSRKMGVTQIEELKF